MADARKGRLLVQAIAFQVMTEKLIRDRIPALAAQEGRQLQTRIATGQDIDRLFGYKLIEESAEVIEALALGKQDALIDELADLQTVIDDLAAHKGISRAAVEQRVRDKRTARGGFGARIVLQGARRSQDRLHPGHGPTFVDALRHELLKCTSAHIAVAFVMRSGLDLLEGPLRAALLRGASVRILTTDYLGVTEPDALARMCKWEGLFEARVYSHPRRSFHPKAYLFEHGDGTGRAFIGSANLSRMGLRDGVEWTWTVMDIDPGHPMAELQLRFEELFASESAQPLSPAFIDDYRLRLERMPARGWISMAGAEGADVAIGVEQEHKGVYRVEAPSPRPVQNLALIELERLRTDGQRRALVVAATGLGKTYLAAFDALAADADRVLFIAHREELLRQAETSFRQVFKGRSLGIVGAGESAYDRDCVFASIQTLSRPENLARPELSRFDYVVIDEFHHAAAESYRRVLSVLKPRFLLGLTATPYRSDNRDLLALCDGNLAYQVGLFDAIAFGWLTPFRYYGVADVVNYTDDLLTDRRSYDVTKLTLQFNTDERARVVIGHWRAQTSKAALGFCVSIEHADFMAQAFNAAGVRSVAVHSGPASAVRSDALTRLANGALRVIFTVDMFNEGVDIPAVDLVMFLRPTESMTVFVQQLGRGLRVHPRKDYLTVLDFIGNYRNVHFKLPFLIGLEGAKDSNASTAFRALRLLIDEGNRPAGLPDGVEIFLDPVALEQLRRSLLISSPLRERIGQDIRDLASQTPGRAPTFLEYQRGGEYSHSTVCKALAVDCWNVALQSLEVLSPAAQMLDAEVGGFLKEMETTAMARSFKMVVVLAMCEAGEFKSVIGIDDLLRFFRIYFAAERHRADVIGTSVEEVESVSATVWHQYLLKNPINAWIGVNTGRQSPFFSWNDKFQEFHYIGPMPRSEGARQRFTVEVHDRVEGRLDQYWSRPGVNKNVYTVIPTGDAVDREGRTLCVMFGEGEARHGMPLGWHPVKINGKYLYGKFVKIALNVLKDRPTDDRSVPNVLSEELIQLVGTPGKRQSGRPVRVRFLRSTGADVWDIQAV